MKASLRFAAVLSLLAISSTSLAQEDEGAFEYGSWTSDGNEATATTLVNDAENRLSIACYTGFAGVVGDYQLIVASDDNGSVADEGWASTVTGGTVTAHLGDGRTVTTPIKVEISDEDGPYGPIFSFHPSSRRGDWYDASDAAFITSVMNSDSLVILLNGRRQNIRMSFSGSGSSRAIRGTEGTSWCIPSNALG